MRSPGMRPPEINTTRKVSEFGLESLAVSTRDTVLQNTSEKFGSVAGHRRNLNACPGLMGIASVPATFSAKSTVTPL